jgi:hypothetical protein
MKRMKQAQLRCSICHDLIEPKGDWYGGNNAEPINDGRCCDVCDWRFVIPARLVLMSRQEKQK